MRTVLKFLGVVANCLAIFTCVYIYKRANVPLLNEPLVTAQHNEARVQITLIPSFFNYVDLHTRTNPSQVSKNTPLSVLWGVAFIYSGGPDRALLTQSSWLSNLASIKYSLEQNSDWNFVVFFCDDSKDSFLIGDDNVTLSILQKFPYRIKLFRVRSISTNAELYKRIRDNVIFSYTHLYNYNASHIVNFDSDTLVVKEYYEYMISIYYRLDCLDQVCNGSVGVGVIFEKGYPPMTRCNSTVISGYHSSQHSLAYGVNYMFNARTFKNFVMPSFVKYRTRYPFNWDENLLDDYRPICQALIWRPPKSWIYHLSAPDAIHGGLDQGVDFDMSPENAALEKKIAFKMRSKS